MLLGRRRQLRNSGIKTRSRQQTSHFITNRFYGASVCRSCLISAHKRPSSIICDACRTLRWTLEPLVNYYTQLSLAARQHNVKSVTLCLLTCSVRCLPRLMTHESRVPLRRTGRRSQSSCCQSPACSRK